MAVARRSLIAGAALAVLPTRGIARDNDVPSVLETLIVEVIDAGDMTNLDQLVTPDVSIPDYRVHGIDAFRAAAEDAHETRQERFTEYAFEPVSIVEADGWAHAFVRQVGTTTAGISIDEPLLYAARLVDGLIVELYA